MPNIFLSDHEYAERCYEFCATQDFHQLQQNERAGVSVRDRSWAAWMQTGDRYYLTGFVQAVDFLRAVEDALHSRALDALEAAGLA